MDLDLEGRTYIVTGGSRGMGLATARVLAHEGARLVIAGRDQATLTHARDELQAVFGAEVTTVAADLADPGTADRLVARAHEEFGRLDGALVSVGGPPAGGFLDVTDDQWQAAFGSVFLGTVRVMRAVARALESEEHGDGGAIAAVLSSSVKAPVANLAVSNGLRPGLAMALKTLADEVGPRGVRVNGLLPGRIDTDRLRELDGGAPDPAAARAGHEAAIPLRRYGRPDEFGRMAAFVLSPAASYLTGAMIPLDGGLTRAL